MRFVLLTVVVLAIGAGSAGAQTAADTGAIRATALDYAEGWYEGNGARMARAVHPELVKRIVMWDSVSKRSVIQTMGATALVNGTFRGFGKDTPADRQEKAVRCSGCLSERGECAGHDGRLDRLPAGRQG